MEWKLTNDLEGNTRLILRKYAGLKLTDSVKAKMEEDIKKAVLIEWLKDWPSSLWFGK
jgi:hypothetical protein